MKGFERVKRPTGLETWRMKEGSDTQRPITTGAGDGAVYSGRATKGGLIVSSLRQNEWRNLHTFNATIVRQ